MKSHEDKIQIPSSTGIILPQAMWRRIYMKLNILALFAVSQIDSEWFFPELSPVSRTSKGIFAAVFYLNQYF